ncbi:MAG: right-handed parallel beta-helix repeat-containing protein, partial [Sedimentisphaerales bacterium]|nr:right-handed parallel beta-helix repeat-containing protein [Sedimentisphaerales bacterium]
MKTHRRIRTILLTGALGLCLAGMLRADNQYPHPWFDAHPNPAWLGTAVELDAGISVDPDGWLEWMDWDWDNDGTWDETVAFGEGTISHTFTQAGEQTVSLRVTDNEGGWCTISLPVEIYDPADPAVRFYVNNDPQVNGLDSPGYGKSPETPFDTIQYALNAVDGTTDYFGDIVVAPGTYAEHIQFQGRHVILTSQDPDDPAIIRATIIDGQNATNPPQPTVRFDGSEDDRTQLRGLTITGGSGLPYPDSGSDSYGGGIWGAHADVTISRCIIRDNAVTGKGGGVCVIEGLIDRCVFYNNTAGTGGGGLSGCIYATIQNCLVHHNDSNGGAGGILNSTNGQILNCTVADNDGAGLENCDRNIITNCIVWGNNAAAQLVNCAHPTYSCIEDYTPADYQRVVGYWMLDETSGTIAVDAVAPCHNGTVNGGYWDEDGVRNGCLGFDGYYDYVSVGDHADFDTRDELSLVFWFQTETAQGYNKIICHDSSDSKYVVHILDDSATLRFQVKLDSGTYTAEATRPTGSWADGVWHLAACTYNKGAHQLRIYVDGQLCICQDCPREFIPYGDQGILIGYYGSSYDYIGRLDETAVYDRTLAAGEVGVLYLQGLAGYGLGLETNINSNPAFVDPDGPDDVLGTPDDDYHLQAASACIDAGDPTAECDQEPDGGNGRINMGAYGNTDQAALADADADGMPDAWEQA